MTDPFKVLCGCVALERFLDQETALEKLAYHLSKGAVRLNPKEKVTAQQTSLDEKLQAR